MPAYKSTYNACLDLYFLGGSYRKRTSDDAVNLFAKAYGEDPDLALMVLAYLRDAREGVGERKLFRTIIRWLAVNSHDFKVSYIPTIGRWDDLLSLIDTPYENDALGAIVDALKSGKPETALCAKWMPRKGKEARLLREFLGIYPRDYRRLLVKNTRVVETQMCTKEWAGINYSHVPSVANIKYNAAFLRNDERRRREFLESAKKGEVKINTSVAFPHTIVQMILGDRNSNSLKEGSYLKLIAQKNDTALAMWKQLPDVIGDGTKRILCCADTSGSMRGTPILISLGISLYCSEKLKGPFQNAFITFSENPEIQVVTGDLYERICQIRAQHPRNTNFERIFTSVLDAAKKSDLKEEDMPTDICVISDMEFDQACGYPKDDAFTLVRKMYADAGYDMPNIIFWNVNARNDHAPVQRNSKGVALISGSSQNAIKSVLGGVTTPVDVMLKSVNVPRYREFCPNK